MNLKHKKILLCLLLWLILSFFLQVIYKFHFFHIEQYQLFLFDSDYLRANMMKVGGFALLISEFLLQFFIYPYAGALVTSLLLTLVGALTFRLIKRIDPDSGLIYLLSLLPVLSLLFMHFDFNYFTQGTVSYLLMLFLFNLFFLFKDIVIRLVYSVVAVFILFYLCGSVAVLLALLVFVKEFFENLRKSLLFLIPCAEAVLLACLSVQFGVIGEYRLALLPDLYFQFSLTPPSIIYLSWIIFPFVIAAAYLLRSKKRLIGKKKIIGLCIQFLTIGAVCFWGVNHYGDFRSLKYKEMEYYYRTKQFDKIIDMNKGRITNYLYGCLLNLSLAKKGELADRVFTFEQNGPQSLLLRMNNTYLSTVLLCDIYYTIGHTGGAMNMAFEANISVPGYQSGRMLQYLIETNLIYGEYPVAEKYIAILEKSFYYSDWAKGMRRYLYNEDEVRKNPEFNTRRKSLSKEDFLFTAELSDKEFSRLFESNPENRTLIEYMGSMYLLMKNLNLFNGLIDKYYGTEILPVLPLSFQEAVIVMTESDAGSWKEQGVSEAVIVRFEQYRKLILENKNRPNLPELVKKMYGDTYWYYFMFKKSS